METVKAKVKSMVKLYVSKEQFIQHLLNEHIALLLAEIYKNLFAKIVFRKITLFKLTLIVVSIMDGFFTKAFLFILAW